MANLYSKNFTLKDLFDDPKLSGILPAINHKEGHSESGRHFVSTSPKSVTKYVYDISTNAASAFFSPLKASRSGDKIEIGGELRGDYETAVNAIYSALLASKDLLFYTANDIDMIRSALTESERNARKYGRDARLYLRVQSKQQISGMTKQQVAGLFNNIIENIMYGDNFAETQKKFNVKELDFGSKESYEQRKLRWQQRVGER